MEPTLRLPERLVVPLFPLPNAILFPGARLPLYIFEPRYKRMIDDIMEAERYLSVALVSGKDNHDRTPRAICGLGHVAEMERLPKNEKNIVVVGLERVQIIREVDSDPYIQAEVKPLVQKTPDAETHEQLFSRLRDVVKSWLFRMRAGNMRRLAEFGGVRSVAEMCDFFGAYLLDDTRERQALLEELDVEARALRIIRLVETQLYRYSAPFEN